MCMSGMNDIHMSGMTDIHIPSIPLLLYTGVSRGGQECWGWLYPTFLSGDGHGWHQQSWPKFQYQPSMILDEVREKIDGGFVAEMRAHGPERTWPRMPGPQSLVWFC